MYKNNNNTEEWVGEK